jgi:hypothetical protein
MRDFVLIDHDEGFANITRRRIDEEKERLGTLARDECLRMFSDAERRLLQEVPVPQADRLDLVFDVLQFVSEGDSSRVAIGKRLAYAPRQGPYYADAALALGLLEDDRILGRSGRTLSVTPLGEAYLAESPEAQVSMRRDIVLNAPILKYVAARLGLVKPGDALSPSTAQTLDEHAIERALEGFVGVGATAHRRAQTLMRWLHDAST